MSFLNNDEPINSKEKDSLGRDGIVNSMANTIIKMSKESLNTSFVMGLFGAWGSGKTSIIKMIIEKLERDSSIVVDKPVFENGMVKNSLLVINFGAWNITSTDQLLSQMLNDITNKLNDYDYACLYLKVYPRYLSNEGVSHQIIDMMDFHDRQKIARQIFAEPSIRYWVRLLPTLVKIMTSKNTTPLLNAATSLVFDVESEFNDYKNCINNKTLPLSEIKEKVIAKLRKLHDERSISFLVIIDDLDRLPDEQINYIFRMIGAVANFPNVIYLLSCDKQIVTQSLNQIYHNEGAHFLEKFIKSSWNVPIISEDTLYRNFCEQFEAFCIKGNGIVDPPGSEYWLEIYKSYISCHIKTPRDLSRLCNIVKIHLDSLGGKNISLTDLVAFSVLEITYPVFIQWIYNYRFLLSDVDSVDFMRVLNIKRELGIDDKDSPEVMHDKLLKEFKRFYSAETIENNSDVDCAIYNFMTYLKLVFPKVASMVNRRAYVDANKLLIHKRFAHENYFFRYLKLYDNLPCITEESLVSIIYGNDEAIAKEIDYYDSINMLDQLLYEVAVYAHDGEFEEKQKYKFLREYLSYIDLGKKDIYAVARRVYGILDTSIKYDLIIDFLNGLLTADTIFPKELLSQIILHIMESVQHNYFGNCENVIKDCQEDWDKYLNTIAEELLKNNLLKFRNLNSVQIIYTKINPDMFKNHLNQRLSVNDDEHLLNTVRYLRLFYDRLYDSYKRTIKYEFRFTDDFVLSKKDAYDVIVKFLNSKGLFAVKEEFVDIAISYKLWYEKQEPAYVSQEDVENFRAELFK